MDSRRIPMLRVFRRQRRTVLLFGLAIIAGSLTMSGLVAVANDGDDRNNKREPVRDDPGTVSEADLPAGEHLHGLSEMRRHGRFEVYPPGQGGAAPTVAGTSAGWLYETFTTGTDTSATGIVVDPTSIPVGYSVVGGGGYRATDPTGVTDIYDAGISIEGSGYPISVTRTRVPSLVADHSFAVTAWGDDSYVMTTLGYVGDTVAVFVHKRPSVSTAELQYVLFIDNNHIVRVEGYVDDFGALVRIAESILRNRSAMAEGGER